MSPVVGGVLGALMGLGLLLIVASIRGVRLLPESSGGPSRLEQVASGTALRRLVLCVLVGLLLALATGWPVVGLAVVVIGLLWPRLAGGSAAGGQTAAKAEAIAVWTESLRDSVAGEIGLEQALPATQAAAPALVAEPLDRLMRELRRRTPMDEAQADFAKRLDSGTAETVAAALILNSNLRGSGLVQMLSELAVAARGQLEMVQKTEAGRKPLRRGTWIITAIVVGLFTLMAVFARDFLAPFDTPIGQGVLALVLAMWIIAFAWARSLSNYDAEPRFLVSREDIAAGVLEGKVAS